MMKKRILFVDDEPLVLRGLHRTLRSLRQEWEMEFVESGAAALDRMSDAPYDVVVSDMRMPGLSGAELLNEVMRRYPKTVRLILSGHADQELILSCVGSTHQYLSKPCEAETLLATIARAVDLDSSMSNAKLMARVSQIGKLPSLPSLYTEIVQCLQSPEFSIDDVGAIIAKDIAMTAQVLKLVNSGFFGLGRRISSPAEAAAYLGAEVLKALVLTTKVFSQYQSATVQGFSVDALWQHSLQTGDAAKIIAKTEHAPAHVIEEAFVAGMLHDTGKLVLAANFPAEYALALENINPNKPSTCDAEREVLGCTHAEVGGYLLGLWGLPAPVVEAIALHHTPCLSSTRVFSALTGTHVANGLINSLASPESQERFPGINGVFLECLGLTDRLPVWKKAIEAKAESAVSRSV